MQYCAFSCYVLVIDVIMLILILLYRCAGIPFTHVVIWSSMIKNQHGVLSCPNFKEHDSILLFLLFVHDRQMFDCCAGYVPICI